MKKWLKRLIVPAVLVLAAGIFVLAVVFDFEHTMNFTDLPPQALESVKVTIQPYYGEVENIELDTNQKARLFDGLDDLETRGIRLNDFALPPEEMGYTIDISGGGVDCHLTMAPGVSRKYMSEGGWFKHNLGDTDELNRYIYQLIENYK